jgi:hypothetical protein
MICGLGFGCATAAIRGVWSVQDPATGSSNVWAVLSGNKLHTPCFVSLGSYCNVQRGPEVPVLLVHASAILQEKLYDLCVSRPESIC